MFLESRRSFRLVMILQPFDRLDDASVVLRYAAARKASNPSAVAVP
jgi:hypothetical protein